MGQRKVVLSAAKDVRPVVAAPRRQRSAKISNLSSMLELHASINVCTHCESACAIKITKPQSMYRGASNARIMTIGQAPGAKAIEKKKAFAGHSFTVLHRWFSEAGFVGGPEDLRDVLYQTSVLKCAPPNTRSTTFRLMAQNCLPFLWRQIELVRPGFVLVLGGRALRAVGSKLDLTKTVGTFLSLDKVFGMFGPRVAGVEALILPHPSPLSRLHNSQGLMNRVRIALKRVVGTVFGEPV